MAEKGTCGILVMLLMLFLPLPAAGHGGGPGIVPERLNVTAGSTLMVSVTGLKGADAAAFTLTGAGGAYDLGTFPVAGEDFEQGLSIPEGLSPGSYRLGVEGGGKEASTVINITGGGTVRGGAGSRDGQKALPHGGDDERAGRAVELRIVRPGWLRASVALLVLASLSLGIWILRGTRG